MRKTLVLPELAESVVEGEIQRWLVAEGDTVAENQPIVEVMTDKATVELPSPFAGVVERLLAKAGDMVAVHAPIAIIREPGTADTAPAPGTAPTEARDASLFKPSTHEETVRNPFLDGVERPSSIGRSSRRFPPPVPHPDLAEFRDREERIPLRGVRRAIAKQMVASHLHAVRTLVVDEADLTRLKETRTRLRAESEAGGIKLTYLPFVFQAVERALALHPELNSSFDDRTQEIVLKRYCNIGLAVSTDAGLMVPVVREVPGKSLSQLAREIEALAARARAGSLGPDESRGSTFTITSIGNVGSLFTFPIINVPDAAILGVHTAKRRPVVVGEGDQERIVIRDMVYLSLSFDHRLVDGAQAADFLRRVIDLLENPEQLGANAPGDPS